MNETRPLSLRNLLSREKRGHKEIILQGMMQGLKVKYIPNNIGPSGTQSRPKMFVLGLERW